MRWKVTYFVEASGWNYNEFFFTDEKKAREKYTDLLAALPPKYTVTPPTIIQ